MAKDEDSSDWNKRIDQDLVSRGIVDQSLLYKMMEAVAYDAASTVTWAEAKLALIEGRLQNGLQVQVFNIDIKDLQNISTVAEFMLWKRRHFPSCQ